MSKLLISTTFLVTTLVFLGAGCTNDDVATKNTTATVTANNADADVDTGTETTYTLDDVAAHATESNCWMVLDGDVYDVTTYIPNHPGGKTLLGSCGTDATAAFGGDNTWGKVHSTAAKALLDTYEIGELAQ